MLDRNKSNVVTTRHNELHEGVTNLSRNFFTLSHVRVVPFIHIGCANKSVKPHPASHMRAGFPSPKTPPVVYKYSGEKYDLLIWYLCQRGVDSIHNMWVVNNDASSYPQRSAEKCLQGAEKEKENISL